VPTFQFYCPPCNRREDRILSHSEIHGQTCGLCGRPLDWEFVPTRSKPVVFANDSRYPRWATGPKQMAREAERRGLLALGDEPLHGVKREHARFHQEAEARSSVALSRDIDGVLEDLGDELYTRDPQPPRHADHDDDLTGAGILDVGQSAEAA